MTHLPPDSTSGARQGGPASVVSVVADIPDIRRQIAEIGTQVGLPPGGVERLALATHEIVANALVHGGGQAAVRIDVEEGRLVVTIADVGTGWRGGPPPDRPAAHQLSGRGLWLADRLCDELEIAHSASGTTIRLAMDLPPKHRRDDRVSA